MIEKLKKSPNLLNKRSLAVVSLVALGSVGIAGCTGDGSTKKASWRIGIACPAPDKAVVTQVHHGFDGDVKVACRNQAGQQVAPTDIELLSGVGTIVKDGQKDTDALNVNYTYTDGGLDGQTPEVDLSLGKTDADISLQQIRTLTEVSFAQHAQ